MQNNEIEISYDKENFSVKHDEFIFYFDQSGNVSKIGDNPVNFLKFVLSLDLGKQITINCINYEGGTTQENKSINKKMELIGSWISILDKRLNDKKLNDKEMLSKIDLDEQNFEEVTQSE